MKDELKFISSGRKVLLSTLILIGLSAATSWILTYSLAQLTTRFDTIYLLLFIFFAYVTLLLVYSIVTIFYNVDKLRGRQKRQIRLLELNVHKGGDSK